MLAISAGIIFLCCAFTPRLAKDITINGIEVGGKTYEAAKALVRKNIEEELKGKSLTVYGKQNNYVFSYPEIGYRDNLQSLLKTAKKGGRYTASVSYYLNGLNEIAPYICADESISVVEPFAIFHAEGEPFSYNAGHDGKQADREKLIEDITASLCGNFEDVYLKVDDVKRSKTLSEVKAETCLLSTFTTLYDGGNGDRAHNIRLAASKINGCILKSGEVFSFNERVGRRTAESGFKPAKVIERGEFVDGIGGGVCQVSTTLFNAALLSGCNICEYHAHSLAVSYVPPSFDAMVSGTSFDLKFQNSGDCPLYIRALTGENYITFNVYGKSDGSSYTYGSEVKEIIPAPEETTENTELLRDGKDGLISEGYLTITKDGVSKTVLLRKDKYAPIKRVILQAQTEDNAN